MWFAELCFVVDPRTNSEVGINRVIAPFVACGDLSGFDSDMTYPVEVTSVYIQWMEPLNNGDEHFVHCKYSAVCKPVAVRQIAKRCCSCR